MRLTRKLKWLPLIFLVSCAGLRKAPQKYSLTMTDLVGYGITVDIPPESQSIRLVERGEDSVQFSFMCDLPLEQLIEFYTLGFEQEGYWPTAHFKKNDAVMLVFENTHNLCIIDARNGEVTFTCMKKRKHTSTDESLF